MAWTNTKWACEHEGEMQLYGKSSARDSRVAYEAGRKCMCCWLVEQWEEENDPRAQREDRYKLAADIAAGKGIRINVSASVPIKDISNNTLADLSDEELLQELKRRGINENK